jgi:hypothetical protein
MANEHGILGVVAWAWNDKVTMVTVLSTIEDIKERSGFGRMRFDHLGSEGTGLKGDSYIVGKGVDE